MVRRRNPLLPLSAAIILGAGLFAALIWGNYRFTSANSGGNDFLIPWVGTREFIQEGLSPYSDETTLSIQTMAYGQPARPEEDQLRFFYPLYSILLFIPFALIEDFALARAVWMAVLELSLILAAFLLLRLVRWRPRPIVLAVYLFFSVFWYHALHPVILGDAAILIGLGIVGILLAIRAGQDELAGILLGLVSIMPHVVVLFLVFIIFWAAANRRWKIIGWLLITLALLSAVGFLLVPGWLGQNLRQILRYAINGPADTLTGALTVVMPGIGSRLGPILSILIGVVTLVEWVIARKANFRGFLWAACFTLTASQWIGIPTAPKNFIIIIPALVLTFAVWVERWRSGGVVLSIVTMLLILGGIWGVALNANGIPFSRIDSPAMFFPLPLIAFFLLYWIRWWAVKPPAVWYELLIQENP